MAYRHHDGVEGATRSLGQHVVGMTVRCEWRLAAVWGVFPITAGTLVPAVLMATSHSYGNGQILTTHRIRTP